MQYRNISVLEINVQDFYELIGNESIAYINIDYLNLVIFREVHKCFVKCFLESINYSQFYIFHTGGGGLICYEF